MASLRQIDANRRNAQKSTGPKSPQGKAASSLNALKTGIHSETAVLPCEDRAAHDALVASYYDRFRPTLPEVRVYVDEIIRCEWTLRRLRRTESELTSYIHENSFDPDPDFPLGQPAAIDAKVFSSLQWRLNAIRKARKEALACLRDLRENPIPDPPPAKPVPTSPPGASEPQQNQPVPKRLASFLKPAPSAPPDPHAKTRDQELGESHRRHYPVTAIRNAAGRLKCCATHVRQAILPADPLSSASRRRLKSRPQPRLVAPLTQFIAMDR